MTASSPSLGRVLRGIEVRDLLSLHERGRSAYTDEDLDDAYRRGAIDARVTMTTEREDAVRGMAVALQDSGASVSRALEDIRAH